MDWSTIDWETVDLSTMDWSGMDLSYMTEETVGRQFREPRAVDGLPRRIALVSCSSRSPRLNPYVTKWVASILARTVPELAEKAKFELYILDIWHFLSRTSLTMTEPLVPAQLPQSDPTPHYNSAPTRAWSNRVKFCDAFIFVTPQYNWSYPASLKFAIDVLYHEWKGKVAAVVTYGQHGGAKAGDHLARVLAGGLKMKLVGGPDLSGMPTLKIDERTLEESIDKGRISNHRIMEWTINGSAEEITRMGEKLIGLLRETD